MGVWVMAGVTFREAARKRILWMALLAGLAFIALFSTGLYFQTKDQVHRLSPLILRQAVSSVLMVGLYAVDTLAVVMTVLTSVDTLSGEIASGTIHAVAAKPVSRWQVLLGKWLGFAGMIIVYLVLMLGGITLITYMISAHFSTGVWPRHLFRGALLIWLECIVMLSLTFRFGASLSTLTNGVLVLGLHGIAFIGGWTEQIGAALGSARAVNVGIVASVIMPSEVLWRRAVYEMQSPVLSAIQFGPFNDTSVPSWAMVAYAGVYMGAALGLAIRKFQCRDL